MLPRMSYRRSVITAILLIAALSATAFGEKMPKATRTPDASLQEHDVLIKQAIALHDQGRYDDAIVLYKRVLEQAPGNVGALYELSFSYFEKKDYENALATGRTGAGFNSELLPRFHMVIGNALDELGKPDEAIDFYKDAIKKSPKFAMLRYNLAVSYAKRNKPGDARKSVQQALLLDPFHASSHLLLATVYAHEGYRVPAVLAYSHFLLLEPNTLRAQEAAAQLERLRTRGVSKGQGGADVQVTLFMNSGSKKDEGDFGSVEVGMSLGSAVELTDAGEARTPFHLAMTAYGMVGGLLSTVKGNGFAVRYYVPFFREMEEKDLVGPFILRALRTQELEGAQEWADENPEKIQEFVEWVSTYMWIRSL